MPRISYETMGEEEEEEAKKADLGLLAEEMFEAWVEEHKKHWPEVYSGTHLAKPPLWKEMDDRLKLCWIAAAKYAMYEYIS